MRFAPGILAGIAILLTVLVGGRTPAVSGTTSLLGARIAKATEAQKLALGP